MDFPHGEQLEYVHMDYDLVYEETMMLINEKGILEETRMTRRINHCIINGLIYHKIGIIFNQLIM
jgi:hypothetical protein